MKILFYAFDKLLCFSSPWIKQCSEFSSLTDSPILRGICSILSYSIQRQGYFHIPLNLIFHLPGIWAHPYPCFKGIIQEPPHFAHCNFFLETRQQELGEENAGVTGTTKDSKS